MRKQKKKLSDVLSAVQLGLKVRQLMQREDVKRIVAEIKDLNRLVASISLHKNSNQERGLQRQRQIIKEKKIKFKSIVDAVLKSDTMDA